MANIKTITNKALKSNSLIFTFMRSAVSSQAASWVDLGTSFVLFAWAGFAAATSTAVGAVAGGIINCIINYKFTFHAQGCTWHSVAIKYAMVWLGSLSLNTFGTQEIYNLLNGWEWLGEHGFTTKGCFAAARLFVSLIVSWFWNFLLQRHFVYKNLPIKQRLNEILGKNKSEEQSNS